MHIIADVNKISKTIPRNLNFILNVLPESSIYFTCNQFHNILRLFDVLPIYLSPQMERWTIITYKHGIYELPH